MSDLTRLDDIGLIVCHPDMKNKIIDRVEVPLPDDMFILSESLNTDMAVVVTAKEFETWLYSEPHDIWTMKEEK